VKWIGVAHRSSGDFLCMPHAIAAPGVEGSIKHQRQSGTGDIRRKVGRIAGIAHDTETVRQFK
jgi:hypothetical protein